jgi:O-acetylhomoserine/O-acetylserine sulfhydrylase-like pyridoxal-dependent enzyme
VLFKKYGIGVKFVTSDDPAAFEAAIDDETKAVYVETIGNPKYNVSPISKISEVCDSIMLGSSYSYIKVRYRSHTNTMFR